MPDSKRIPLPARSILRLCGPDQPGILSEVAQFINARRGNIVSLQQLVDREENHLFMRVKWTSTHADACDIDIEKAFKSIADKYKLNYFISCSTTVRNLGLFASTTTHALARVLYRHSVGDLKVNIPLIIANSRACEVIAKRYNIPFYYIPTKDPDYEKKQIALLKQYNIDFIGLARYMKVLSPEFIAEYPEKIINIHHSFLPSFVGAKPYEEAHKRGVKLMGATSHFVIPELDQGPIIQQDVARVKEGYDAENLAKQGEDVESGVFYYALEKYVADKLIIYKNRVVVFN